MSSMIPQVVTADVATVCRIVSVTIRETLLPASYILGMSMVNKPGMSLGRSMLRGRRSYTASVFLSCFPLTSLGFQDVLSQLS